MPASDPAAGTRARIRRFLEIEACCKPRDLILVAFSGGSDSLALAIVLDQLSHDLGFRILLAHLDHVLDSESDQRASEASDLASRLDLPVVNERVDVRAEKQAGESTEAAARRIRYDFLERVADRESARYIATGHHRDDQAETVLLRMLFGTGLTGLSGIQQTKGRWIRPLLRETKGELFQISRILDLEGIEDPGNRDLRHPRNRIRHHLLACLDDDVSPVLAQLAETSARLRRRLEPRLLRLIAARKNGETVVMDRSSLAALPPPLFDLALAAADRLVGRPYPARKVARSELRRQLDSGGLVGCDCSDDWRWQSGGSNELLLRRRPHSVPDFSYNLEVPGELTLFELNLSVRLSRWRESAERFDETANRVCFAWPLQGGKHVTIRNRRPGDRIRPAGHRRERRLKEILIDRKIPREDRDRLPLLCVGERLVWVPGITIDERMRPSPEREIWVAEVMKA